MAACETELAATLAGGGAVCAAGEGAICAHGEGHQKAHPQHSRPDLPHDGGGGGHQSRSGETPSRRHTNLC